MTTDDELRQVWQSLDTRLERIELHAASTAADKRAWHGRFWLMLFGAGQLVKLVLGTAIVVVFAQFWIAHSDVPHAFIYGAAMHLYGVLLAITAGEDLHAVLRLDASAPVLAMQERFAAIRRRRARWSYVLAIAGCVMWVPLVLAALYAVGVDVWVARPAVVAHFAAWAAIAVVVALVLMRRYPETGLTGSLRRAEAALVTTRDFGRD